MNINIMNYENNQYLEMLPQYHSASHSWLSSALSHAAIALVMFLGWSSENRGNKIETELSKKSQKVKVCKFAIFNNNEEIAIIFIIFCLVNANIVCLCIWIQSE